MFESGDTGKKRGTHVAGRAGESGHRSPTARLRSYFLRGIVVTAPIALTLYLSWRFLTWVDSRIAALLPPDYNPNTYLSHALHFEVPGIGLVIVGVFFVVAGWFASNIVGRLFVRVSEFFVERMPVVRGLYTAIKQVFETLMTSRSNAFREVVMVEFPRPGVWALGFVTGVTEGEFQSLSSGHDKMVNVFVPTAPSPVNGFLIFVPRRALKTMAMSVEEAMKMIVSMGVLMPPGSLSSAGESV